ncbi:unnamed protein product [Acanthosepion pharaonis]|uniref:Uncharacterized protein n=1 Tax=Acanthosepion pharaonis TaxID=158019 RepID=A0A812EIT2_ACAPH|nr:unnamed protein product [Sepia pharaonis]
MHRTQPHMVPLSRKLSAADRTSPVKKHLFKNMRSNFRSSSINSPFSIAQPGFVSLDRKITSRSLAGAPSAHAISKSIPLIHKSSSRVDRASKPKKTTTQVEAALMKTSPSGTAQIAHGDTAVSLLTMQTIMPILSYTLHHGMRKILALPLSLSLFSLSLSLSLSL